MDFEVLDAGDFYKLEKVGPYVYHRPSPPAVWPKSSNPLYDHIDAKYERYQNCEMQHTSFGHLVHTSPASHVKVFER